MTVVKLLFILSSFLIFSDNTWIRYYFGSIHESREPGLNCCFFFVSEPQTHYSYSYKKHTFVQTHLHMTLDKKKDIISFSKEEIGAEVVSIWSLTLFTHICLNTYLNINCQITDKLLVLVLFFQG